MGHPTSPRKDLDGRTSCIYKYGMARTRPADDVLNEMSASCVAGRIRVLNRLVTRIFDEELRDLGLTVAQANVLVVVGRLGPVPMGQVGERLSLEKSTLSRNVERMVRQGWIDATPGDDGRTQLLRLTPAGRKLIAASAPAWRRAQGRSEDLLGRTGVDSIARMARRAGGMP